MANPNPTTEIFPQIDARIDIDGATWNLNAITNESVALVAIADAAANNYKIGYLAERPAVLNFASSNAAPAISGFSLVTTLGAIDATSKFYVDYDRAFILCHSTQGSPVSVTYSGMGSITRSREINNIHFGHNYLGPKSSAPSVDNEGNALATGDQYYNTASNKMFVYTGSAWEDLAVAQAGNTLTSADGYNLVLTTNADGENVQINSGGTKSYTLPNVRGTADYVLTTDGVGGTSWTEALKAPVISSTSGQLNADSDSTITIHGTDFQTGIVASIWNASSVGTKHGDASTTTVVNSSTLTAAFGEATIPASGTVYVEVEQSGLTSRLSVGIAVSADPTASFTGGSGVSYAESSHLGTYGGSTGGGGETEYVALLMHFDRANLSIDFECNENTYLLGGGTGSSSEGAKGHIARVNEGSPIISTAAHKFGVSEGAQYDSSGLFIADDTDRLEVVKDTGFFCARDFTFDFWINFTTIADSSIIDFRAGGANLFYLHPVDSTTWRYDLGGQTVDFAVPAMSTGTWYHILTGKDGTDGEWTSPDYRTAFFYFNGAPCDTKNTTSAALTNAALLVAEVDNANLVIGYTHNGYNPFDGYIDEFRYCVKDSTRKTGDPCFLGTGALDRTDGGDSFSPPTSPYGGATSATIPTITFTGVPGTGGGDVDFAEIANTGLSAGVQKFSDYGLTFTDGGAGSNTATLTGTLTVAGGTTVTGQKVKATVTVSDATCDTTDGDATITMDSTVKVNAGMTVTGTGIPAGATVSSVTNATTFELSANATATNTNTTLRFGDPNRVAYVNGNEDGSGTHLTIVTGAGGAETLFRARRYEGTGVARSITGFSFQPDFLIVKNRSVADSWIAVDVLRGATKRWEPDTSATPNEATDSGRVSAFNSDGFNVGTEHDVNASTEGYIAYGFKAGGSGSAVSSGLSNVSSVTQSVNTTGGFSITKWSGPGSTTAGYFPHGLGVAPDFIIICNLSDSSTARDIVVWFRYGLSATTGKYLLLNTDATEQSDANVFPTIATSTNIYTGASELAGGSNHNFVCYAFASKSGIMQQGKYTGTGNANTVYFNTTGDGDVDANINNFTPRMIICRRTSSTGQWFTLDKWRCNPASAGWENPLMMDAAIAETAADAENKVTPASGSFAFGSSATSTHCNGSGSTYAYVAFA